MDIFGYNPEQEPVRMLVRELPPRRWTWIECSDCGSSTTERVVVYRPDGETKRVACVDLAGCVRRRSDVR